MRFSSLVPVPVAVLAAVLLVVSPLASPPPGDPALSAGLPASLGEPADGPHSPQTPSDPRLVAGGSPGDPTAFWRSPSGGVAARAAAAGARAPSGGSFGQITEPGTRRVHVVLGRSPVDGKGDRTTARDIKRVFSHVNRYFQAVSGGKVRVRVVSVSPWVSVSPPCSLAGLEQVAKQRKIPFGGMNHALLYQPGCQGAGFAEVFGNLAFINGGMASDVFAHEFAHNLGLGHSNFASCSALFEGDPCPLERERARAVEYGDASDVMGGYPWFDGKPKAIARSVAPGLNPLSAEVLGASQRIVSIQPERLAKARTVTLVDRSSKSGTHSVRVKWGKSWVYLSFMGPASAPTAAGLQTSPDVPEGVLLAHSAAGFFTNVHSFNVFRPVSDPDEGLNPFFTPMGSGLFEGLTLPLSPSTMLEVVDVSPTRARLLFRPVDARDVRSTATAVAGPDVAVSWKLSDRSGVVSQEVVGYQLVGSYPQPGQVFAVAADRSEVTVSRASWFTGQWRFVVRVTYQDGTVRSTLTRSVPSKQ